MGFRNAGIGRDLVVLERDALQHLQLIAAMWYLSVVKIAT